MLTYGTLRSSRFLGYLVAFLVVAAAFPWTAISTASAQLLQLHYDSLRWWYWSNTLRGVNYQFTEDGIPMEGENGTVDLTYCQPLHIPYPAGATDVTVDHGLSVSHSTCQARVAAFQQNGGTYAMMPAGAFRQSVNVGDIWFPWLAAYTGDDATQTFTEYGALYIGIDIAAYYNAGGATWSPDQEFSIVDGLCAALPGYVFGTRGVNFDTGAGWVADGAYTGTATAFAEVGDCPEPSSLLLLGVAAVGLLVRRRRR
jgi:hypothetical protein